MEMSEVLDEASANIHTPRRPLPSGRLYHFNVVYNHAKSKLSKTADTELSLAWTKQAVEWLQLMGLVNSYYHDRDCPVGQGLVQELTRVLEGSEVTVVVLSPGFVRDCWPRYSMITCFKSLWNNSSKTTSFSSVSKNTCRRVIPVALGLDPKDLPAGLKASDVLFFKKDWEKDNEAWSQMKTAILTSLPAGGSIWDDGDDDQGEDGIPKDDVKQHTEQRLSPISANTKLSDAAKTDLSWDVKGNCDVTGSRTSPRGGTPVLSEHQTSHGPTAVSPRADSNTATSPRFNNDGAHRQESSWRHLGQPESSASANDISTVKQYTRQNHNGHTYVTTTTVTSQHGTFVSSTDGVNGAANSGQIGARIYTETSSSYSFSHSSPDGADYTKPDQELSLSTKPDSYQLLTNDRSSWRVRHVHGDEDQSSSSSDRLSVVEKTELCLVRGSTSFSRSSDHVTSMHTSETFSRESPLSFDTKSHNAENSYTHNTHHENEAVQSKNEAAERSRGGARDSSHKTSSDDIESAVLDRLALAGIRRESFDSSRQVWSRGTTGGNDRHAVSPTSPDESEDVSDNNTSQMYQEAQEGHQTQQEIADSTPQTDSNDAHLSEDENTRTENNVASSDESVTLPPSGAITSAEENSAVGNAIDTDVVDSAICDDGKEEQVSEESVELPKSHMYQPGDNSVNSDFRNTVKEEHDERIAEAFDNTIEGRFCDTNEEKQSESTLETAQTPTLHQAHVAQATETPTSSQNSPPEEVEEKEASSVVNFHIQETVESGSNQDMRVRSQDKVEREEEVKSAQVQELADNSVLLTKPSETIDTGDDYSHVTSIEDEHHDFSFSNDFLSTSLTSDYGTMSPRNDLSGISNPDYGFVSGSLSSFGDSPRQPQQSSPRPLDNLSSVAEEGSMLSLGEGHSPQNRKGAHADSRNQGIANDSRDLDSKLLGGFSAEEKHLPQSSPLENSSPADGTCPKKHEELAISSQSVTFSSSKNERFSEIGAKSGVKDFTTHKPVTVTGGALPRNDLGAAKGEGGLADPLKIDGVAVGRRLQSASRDTWEYADLDKPWSLSELLLPLYRIMVYAFTRPEMPYF